MQKIVLYLTSKAFRQTIDHAVKEAGLVTLDCNNVIGNTVSIEEFMNKKGYLLGDNDIDYLIVDLSALIDREESIVNALSGFLTMHDEKVRVIVLLKMWLEIEYYQNFLESVFGILRLDQIL